jgi:hypothetical protein
VQVCIAIVRFVVPVPIALRSVFSIARTVRSHDWAEVSLCCPLPVLIPKSNLVLDSMKTPSSTFCFAF